MKLIKLPFLLLTGSIFMISCGDNKDEKKIVEKEEKLSIETLQDSIHKLSEELSDARYFDIQYNEDSQYFFYENGIEDSEEFVRQQLMATNITKDENHPLISYRPRRNAKFQINKIKLLNHRWVICDFSDGLDWGELLLKMTLNDDKTLSFEVLDQTLYVSEQKP
ncbi:hydrolase [uncultured Capnocytophaga sp.]|uniref:hydrolase n=1 Tax=uncultured Capnocytophaga sp. TaxID=159273 RepID=UPI00263A32EF|nr:hydrolase [uncultured Capnocytophaga sp.]